jgi:pimeloyl-ACP methyl ester carboxylesterase
MRGGPYGIHAFAEAVPLLVSAGYRVIVPHLRGHGTTRFLSVETERNGQQVVIVVDIIALMNARGIERAVLAGSPWGPQTANIIAAGRPRRLIPLLLPPLGRVD